MPTEKGLGIHWNIVEDKFGFDANFKISST